MKSIFKLLREYLELGIESKKQDIELTKLANRGWQKSIRHAENGIDWHNFQVNLHNARIDAKIKYLESIDRDREQEKEYQICLAIQKVKP